jgi:hypothetical protein
LGVLNFLAVRQIHAALSQLFYPSVPALVASQVMERALFDYIHAVAAFHRESGLEVPNDAT